MYNLVIDLFRFILIKSMLRIYALFITKLYMMK
jgi:hypothetical protein